MFFRDELHFNRGMKCRQFRLIEGLPDVIDGSPARRNHEGQAQDA
jgi:hypothetical protein